MAPKPFYFVSSYQKSERYSIHSIRKQMFLKQSWKFWALALEIFGVVCPI